MEYDATTSNPPKSTTNECVVGLEDLIGRLKRELDYNGKEGPRLSLIYIWGMGGSGKTTVARLLFDDDMIQSNFQFKAWIRASDKRITRELFQCITDSLKTEHKGKELTQQDEMTERDLRRQIGGYLAQYPNYLVVLDDLFPIHNWDSSMEEAFPDTKNHSRIIITTRKKPLIWWSRMVRMHIEELSLLSPADSWDLFCKKTSKGGGGGFMSCSPSSELLARDMVERCGGLPLAIVVLAHLLSKTPPGHWPLVEEHMWQKLKKESPDEISKLLTPTYNNLPQALQHCFLYTAMFPEGYEFDVQKLLGLYLAEGFTTLPREIMAVQFDRSDLDELIEWNLIQVTGKLWEEPVKCKVHGLIHHLSIEKAQEVSFFDLFFSPQKGHGSIPLHPRSRQAVHGYLQDFISLTFQKNEKNNSQLGTLLFFKPQHEYFIEVNELASRCMIFERLRVLDLNGINFSSNEKHLHEMLGILIYLKFLGLGNTFIRKLPPSIGNLKLLQTLDVHGKYSCALPPEMSQLKALRYLRGHFRGPNLYLNGLTKMHTLGAVDVEQLSRLDGSQLRNLRELTLCHGTKGQPLSLESMPILKDLNSLILVSSSNEFISLEDLRECWSLSQLWLHGRTEVFPIIYFFKNLKTLILSESVLIDDPLEVLSRIPNLESLELINCYKRKKMVCPAGGFPVLRVLRLTEFYELEKLEVRAGGMPSIEGLAIHECSDKLKLLPPEKFEKIPRLPQSETGSYLRDILVGQSHKLDDETRRFKEFMSPSKQH